MTVYVVRIVDARITYSQSLIIIKPVCVPIINLSEKLRLRPDFLYCCLFITSNQTKPVFTSGSQSEESWLKPNQKKAGLKGEEAKTPFFSDFGAKRALSMKSCTTLIHVYCLV